MSLAGKLMGAGTIIGLAGARIETFAIDPDTAERLGPAACNERDPDRGSTSLETAATLTGWPHVERSALPVTCAASHALGQTYQAATWLLRATAKTALARARNAPLNRPSERAQAKAAALPA